MKINAFEANLNRHMSRLLAGCMLFAVVSCFLETRFRPDRVNLIAFMGGALFWLVLGGGFYLLCEKCPRKPLKLIFAGIVLLVFCGYLYEIYKVQLEPKVDLSHIIKELNDMVAKKHLLISDKKYFGFYTNNIPLTILLYYVAVLGSRIMGSSYDLQVVGSVFNVLMIWLGFFCICGLIDLYTDNRKGDSTSEGSLRMALFMKLVAICNPIWFVYASYFYTDTISLPFAAGGLLLVLYGDRAVKDGRTAKAIARFFAGSVLFTIAYMIRPTCMIMVIALFVHRLYTRRWKKLVLLAVTFASAFMIVSAGYGRLYQRHVAFDTTDRAVPITHFLMMGSHDRGSFHDEDVQYTKSLKTHEEKVSGTWNRYLSNLKHNGFKGNVKLFLEKELLWGVGTRGYYQYVANARKDSLLHQFLAGRFYMITAGLLQGYNFFLLLFAGMGIWMKRKEAEDLQVLLLIYFVGAILFTMLWEAHPRHLLTYMSYIYLMSVPFWRRCFKVA